MLRWLIGIILGEIIYESSNWQHVQRLKVTILGANWQLFSLEKIAKCSYLILSTQNIKFYLFVMKIKNFLLTIWWCNRGLFPVGNKYFGSSFWISDKWVCGVENDSLLLCSFMYFQNICDREGQYAKAPKSCQLQQLLQIAQSFINIRIANCVYIWMREYVNIT